MISRETVYGFGVLAVFVLAGAEILLRRRYRKTVDSMKQQLDLANSRSNN